MWYTSAMERVDDLQFQGLRLLQDDALPCFTEDAVPLVHFLRLGSRDRAIDIGCGTGVIAVLGAAYTGAAFTGIDVQAPLIDLAARSAAMNGQDIRFETLDVREAPARFGHGSFTAVVLNPPYYPADAGAPRDARAVSRHADADLTGAMLRAAFLLLKNGGRLFLCYPCAGLAEILCRLRETRLTPKRMRLVAGSAEAAPYLALIEAKKDAKPGLLMEPILFLHEKT